MGSCELDEDDLMLDLEFLEEQHHHRSGKSAKYRISSARHYYSRNVMSMSNYWEINKAFSWKSSMCFATLFVSAFAIYQEDALYAVFELHVVSYKMEVVFPATEEFQPQGCTHLVF